MTTQSFPSGLFTTADAQAAGISRTALAAAVQSGDLRRWWRGVYSAPELIDSTENRVRALAMVVAPDHVVIDRTAASLHGVDAFALQETIGCVAIETAALPTGKPTRCSGADGRARDLLPRDIEQLAGIRATTALRTALDLGCNLHRKEALAAMIGLARTAGFTAADLRRELPRFKGRRGVVQLRELIPLVDTRIESPREAWTWAALHDAGLPMPEPQLWIYIDGVATYRLDFAWPAARVCVEYDGFDAHEADPAKKEYDEARRAWLRRNGWTIIVVRRGDFAPERLFGWLTRIEHALAAPYTTRRW